MYAAFLGICDASILNFLLCHPKPTFYESINEERDAMPEELYPGLYRNKIPLPKSPLKYLNSYVVKGDERNLVIDTGLNRDVCKEAMMEGLAELDISLESVDLFITHLHADHFGLVSEMATANTRIYFNKPDSEMIENWQGFDPMIRYGGKHGFPESALRDALDQHPGFKYGTGWMPGLSLISDGDTLTYGPYEFACVQTPGHTQGHTCLYNAKHRFLIAGDHILYDITPNIQCWNEDTDPLKAYMESLDKVYQLPVDRVLPGHRNLFDNYQDRIDELKNHHIDRLEEILGILADSAQALSAYQVASRMHWDISAKDWEAFPVAQKWFATGEAIAHLRLLENEGRIHREQADPVILFRA